MLINPKQEPNKDKHLVGLVSPLELSGISFLSQREEEEEEEEEEKHVVVSHDPRDGRTRWGRIPSVSASLMRLLTMKRRRGAAAGMKTPIDLLAHSRPVSLLQLLFFWELDFFEGKNVEHRKQEPQEEEEKATHFSNGTTLMDLTLDSVDS